MLGPFRVFLALVQSRLGSFHDGAHIFHNSGRDSWAKDIDFHCSLGVHTWMSLNSSEFTLSSGPLSSLCFLPSTEMEHTSREDVKLPPENAWRNGGGWKMWSRAGIMEAHFPHYSRYCLRVSWEAVCGELWKWSWCCPSYTMTPSLQVLGTTLGHGPQSLVHVRPTFFPWTPTHVPRHLR